MLIYEFYWLDSMGKSRFLGILPERRKDSIRITKESVMNWGRALLDEEEDNHKIFFKPVIIDCLPERILSYDLCSYTTGIES